MATGRIRFREVTRDTWPDFEALFESRGAPSYCWCMVFRADGEEKKDTSRTGRKRAMQRRVRTGTPVGLLAYRGEAPVGWCSVAPKRTFHRLGGEAPEDDAIWSVTCFFVRREERGTKLGERLLAAAIAHARKRGARIIEGYPVAPSSPSYRFMGFLPVFERAGFTEVGTEGTRRHIVRRSLRRAGRSTTAAARSPAAGGRARPRRSGRP